MCDAQFQLAGEAPSLQARFDEFQLAKKKQPAEATKLWNYVTAVERYVVVCTV